MSSVRFYCLGLLLVFAPTQGLANNEINCISRYHQKPSFEEFRAELLARFDRSAEIERREGWESLTQLIRQYYAEFTPRDNFCIMGDNASIDGMASVRNTYGGDLFLLVPQGLGINNGLISPDDFQGGSIAEAIGREVVRISFPAPSEGCNQYLTGYPLEPIPTPQYHECQAQLRSAMEGLQGRVADEVDSFRSAEPGEIHVFEYPNSIVLREQRDAHSAVQDFVAAAISREMVMEMVYAPTTAAVLLGRDHSLIVEDSTGVDVLNWLAAVVEGEMHDAAIHSAIGVMDMASGDAALDAIENTLEQRVSLYREIVSADWGTPLEAAVADFVCETSYPDLLQLSGREPFWLNIASYSRTVCGFGDAGENLIFNPEGVARTSPGDIRELLGFIGSAELSLRLESRLGELSGIQLDQSQLINDLRELGYDAQFQERLRSLTEALRVAEEAARAPTVLQQLGTLGDLAASVLSFVAAGGGLTDLWSSIPSGSISEQSRHLWSQREEIGEVAGAFSSAVSDIERELNEVERWINRNRNIQEVERLRQAIEELEVSYRGIIAEIEERRRSFRVQAEDILVDIASIQLERAGVRRLFASSVGDIVSLNLIAHFGSPGGAQAISQCGRAVQRRASVEGAFDLPILLLHCLNISEQIALRRSCARATQTSSNIWTTVRAGNVSAIVAEGDMRDCFE